MFSEKHITKHPGDFDKTQGKGPGPLVENFALPI